MTVEKFKRVTCRSSHRRWTLEDSVHCNTVVDAAGDWHWAAWHETDDGGRMGDIESGRASDEDEAEHLAKLAAVRLLSEALASSEGHSSGPTLVSWGSPQRRSR